MQNLQFCLAETSEIAVCNGETLTGFGIKREEIVLDLGSADFRKTVGLKYWCSGMVYVRRGLDGSNCRLWGLVVIRTQDSPATAACFQELFLVFVARSFWYCFKIIILAIISIYVGQAHFQPQDPKPSANPKQNQHGAWLDVMAVLGFDAGMSDGIR